MCNSFIKEKVKFDLNVAMVPLSLSLIQQFVTKFVELNKRTNNLKLDMKLDKRKPYNYN